MDQLYDIEQPLRDIHADHMAGLTMSMELDQFDTGTGKMFIALLSAVNKSGTVKNNSVGMVHGSLVLKNVIYRS